MLPETLKSYLNERQAAYAIEPWAFSSQFSAEIPGEVQERIPADIRHVREASSATADSSPFARTVPLADERGIVLAVLPSDRVLDINALCGKLGRDLYPLTTSRAQALFQNCEEQSWPPFAKAYGVQAIVDVSLYSQLTIRFTPGRRNTLLRMSVQEFQRIMEDVPLARFSIPLRDLDNGLQLDALSPGAHEPFAELAANAVATCENLPLLPDVAGRIFELAADPNASAQDLARVIELDSALTSNILRYANSPYYGYAGKISDVQSAIARVLGFDMALGLAIGMSIGRSFRIPTEGPFGLNAYRRNAVYCATLAQRLARAPTKHTAAPGIAYVAGLLHNFGQLFLGHVFPREYALLDAYLLANSHVSMPDLERYLLGIGHAEIAASLLQSWHLPESIVAAVRHHHDRDYRGDHAVYARLVLIANHALARHGLGINETDDLPVELLGAVGLSEDQVREIAEQVWENRADMETLAQLVA